jgi:DNA polymerase-3 subunit delta'
LKFSNIIGQQAAKQHLLDAIHRGRLPHALMLRGPSGVGAMQMAHAIAQYVNCLNQKDGDSCGECSSCRKISQAIHPDIHYVLPIISKTEKGKAVLTEAYLEDFRKLYTAEPYFSNEQWQHALGGENKQLMISVHEIRQLKRKIFLKTFEAEYKVVILWQAELIRKEAANAFLKLLEEPPDKTLILLTCEDPSKLLITINSRCQQVALGRIPADLLQHYLIEKKSLEAAKAQEIATIAEGSLSNALTYMQESHHELTELYGSWLRMVYTGNYARIQQIIEKIYKENKEFQKLFLAFAVTKLRDSLLYQMGLPQLALVTEAEKKFHENFSKLLTAEKVEKMVDLLDQSRRYIAGNAHAQMAFMALSLRLHSILRY